MPRIPPLSGNDPNVKRSPRGGFFFYALTCFRPTLRVFAARAELIFYDPHELLLVRGKDRLPVPYQCYVGIDRDTFPVDRQDQQFFFRLPELIQTPGDLRHLQRKKAAGQVCPGDPVKRFQPVGAENDPEIQILLPRGGIQYRAKAAAVRGGYEGKAADLAQRDPSLLLAHG